MLDFLFKRGEPKEAKEEASIESSGSTSDSVSTSQDKSTQTERLLGVRKSGMSFDSEYLWTISTDS